MVNLHLEAESLCLLILEKDIENNSVDRSDLIFIWAAFAQSVAVVIRQIKGVKKADIEL